MESRILEYFNKQQPNVAILSYCTSRRFNSRIRWEMPCVDKPKSTMVTMEQMVDIALGTPEIGAVNFNVLHALLHVIVQQMDAQSCLVEFKGHDSERMERIIMSARPGPILKLSEYMIDTNDLPCESTNRSKIKDGTGSKTARDAQGSKSARGAQRSTANGFNPCECDEKAKGIDEKPEKADKGKDEMEISQSGRKKKETPCPCPSEEGFRGSGAAKDGKGGGNGGGRDGGKEDDEADGRGAECSDSTKKGTPYYGSGEGCQTIVRVEPIGERCDTWRSRPALAHESMVKLEEKVKMLQDAFEELEQIPTNKELINKMKIGGGSSATPVKDLWQLYNLHKRTESCEVTIAKLATMIEDLIKDTSNFREAMLVIADAVDDREGTETPGGAVHAAGASRPADSARAPTKSRAVGAAGSDVPDSAGSGPNSGIRGGGTAVPDAPQADAKPSNASSRGGAGPDQPGSFRGGGPVENAPAAPDQDFTNMSIPEKITALKENVDAVVGHVKTMTEVMPVHATMTKLNSIVGLQKQLDTLDAEWRDFLDSAGEGGTTGLIHTTKSIRNDVDNMNLVLGKVMDDKQDLEMTLQNLVQDIDYLKRDKADKDVMEDLLAGKADAALMNKKVSHDQFDAACDDLTKGLDEALEKLMAQEAMWNEAMEELQKDMDNKLDKAEIMPLKEFINKKLQALQDKLKELAQMKKDAEAAGAKSRVLRNLSCIACDGDVVMRMDSTGSRTSAALSTHKSNRPYIAYELDQVRKALKKGPSSRNVNQLEEIFTEGQRKNTALPISSKETIDQRLNKLEHLCNRYCGGSHTITTPQQRVTRIGHFLTEFGPQAAATLAQENLQFPDAKSGVLTPMNTALLCGAAATRADPRTLLSKRST